MSDPVAYIRAQWENGKGGDFHSLLYEAEKLQELLRLREEISGDLRTEIERLQAENERLKKMVEAGVTDQDIAETMPPEPDK